MKKKNPISRFFSSIARFVDRKIVVPITKVVLKITDLFGSSSKRLENWLSNQNTLLFISLL